MKTRNEQIAGGLKSRLDQIEIWRDQQTGYATSLYVNEFISDVEYLDICKRIHAYFDNKIEQDNILADKIRNS